MQRMRPGRARVYALSKCFRRGVPMPLEGPVHPTIPVSDIDRARSFYEKTLGLSPAPEQRKAGDLPFDVGEGARLVLVERPDHEPADFTLASFEVADIREAMEDLRSRGVEFEEYDLPDLKTEEGIARFEGELAAWFRDPDGNFLCLHEYTE